MTPVQAGGRLCAYLEKDEGLSRLLWSEKTHGLRRRERRALERRWRGERNRSVPSASAVFRYLSEFHDPEEEIRRQPHTAFIPADNDALRGLKKVNVDMVGSCSAMQVRLRRRWTPYRVRGRLWTRR